MKGRPKTTDLVFTEDWDVDNLYQDAFGSERDTGAFCTSKNMRRPRASIIPISIRETKNLRIPGSKMPEKRRSAFREWSSNWESNSDFENTFGDAILCLDKILVLAQAPVVAEPKST
jgi:hypothetical protein